MPVKKKDVLYYVRVFPNHGMYDLCEMIVRTVTDDDWFVTTDKRSKQAFLFYYNDIGKIIFKDRKEALTIIKEAEKNKKQINEEVLYEEC